MIPYLEWHHIAYRVSSNQIFYTDFIVEEYFFIVTINGYSRKTKVKIVSTYFRDNETDLLTQTNILFPSQQFNQG